MIYMIKNIKKELQYKKIVYNLYFKNKNFKIYKNKLMYLKKKLIKMQRDKLFVE